MSVKSLILLAFLSCNLVSSNPIAKRSIPIKAGYTLTFGDDFTGSSLSTTSWKYDTGTSYNGGPVAWGTGEVESHTTKNVAVSNGVLTITPTLSKGKWTSGRIETVNGNFMAQPGKKMVIEASIYLGNTRASQQLGIWPAFWALGQKFRTNGNQGWPDIGEWDIMESINGASTAWSTVHCGTNPNGACNEPNGRGFSITNTRGAYHTYALLVDRAHGSWRSETVTWYLDGVQVGQVRGGTVANATAWANLVHAGFFLILDVAVGGAFPDAIAGVTTPTSATVGGSGSRMSVDYVAVYNSK